MATGWRTGGAAVHPSALWEDHTDDKELSYLMENKDPQVQLSTNQGFPEELPYILTCDASETIAGFDNVECTGTQSVTIPNPQEDAVAEKGSETPKIHSQANVIELPPLHSPVQASQCHQSNLISISLLASAPGIDVGQAIKVLFGDKAASAAIDEQPNQPVDSSTSDLTQAKMGMFHSRSIPVGSSYGTTAAVGKFNGPFEDQQRMRRSYSSRDKRFDPFKTWSGRLERQLSNLRGKPQEPDVEANDLEIKEIEAVPAVECYVDALEGPELDTLRTKMNWLEGRLQCSSVALSTSDIGLRTWAMVFGSQY
uniref:Uncharacterized protein LOC114914327 n=1 Tax=Elaeis guineensis var. tenera TaxID=51953 RepID=A0A8N4EY70_ELAGV|nr:uncharacterized protein LOC114914327 [Elaeis guineensis]